jgi:hypothetical protein
MAGCCERKKKVPPQRMTSAVSFHHQVVLELLPARSQLTTHAHAHAARKDCDHADSHTSRSDINNSRSSETTATCDEPAQYAKDSDPAASDGLVVMARGLGTRQALVMLLKIYSNPKNLVLLLNTEKREFQMLKDDLVVAALETEIGGGNTPSIMVDCFRDINADNLVNERYSIQRPYICYSGCNSFELESLSIFREG